MFHCFPKRLHHRYLVGFKIHLCIPPNFVILTNFSDLYEKFVLIQRFFYHFLSIFDFISCYAIHTTTSIFLQNKIRMQTSEGRKVQNKSWTLGIWIVYGEQGILTQTFSRTCIIIITTAIKIKFQA